jgi:hypothetical protein
MTDIKQQSTFDLYVLSVVCTALVLLLRSSGIPFVAEGILAATVIRHPLVAENILAAMIIKHLLNAEGSLAATIIRHPLCC